MTAIVGRITGRVLEEPKSVRPLEEVPRRPALTGQQWYLVHSVRGHDRLTRDMLKASRFTAYYPQERYMERVPQRELSKRQRANTIPVLRSVTRPLLPGYLFVLMDLRQDRWQDLFEFIGLFGILCAGEIAEPRPYPLHPAVVATLRAKEIDGAIPAKLSARKLVFEVGEQVRIKGDSDHYLAGHNAVVDRIPDAPLEGLDESDRIRLVVALFGGVQTKPFEILVSDIEKL